MGGMHEFMVSRIGLLVSFVLCFHGNEIKNGGNGMIFRQFGKNVMIFTGKQRIHQW